jgi:hypothetical protein
MTDIEWQPLPPFWPAPAVWTDVGDLMLRVYTQDGCADMGGQPQGQVA